MPEEIGKNFVRTMDDKIDVDLEQRILRRAVIATAGLANDGWIIVPEGIDVAAYLQNPIVRAEHGYMSDPIGTQSVVGRCIKLEKVSGGLIAETQFADNELGRDYAYLYGVNEKKEVYMRAWSINVRILESAQWGYEQARQFAGPLWDENIAAMIRERQTIVNAATRSLMREYSAVAIGADQAALTRAAQAGNKTAGALAQGMAMRELLENLSELKRTLTTDRERLARLEEDIKALRGKEASAAARSDTEALLQNLRELSAIAKKKE